MSMERKTIVAAAALAMLTMFNFSTGAHACDLNPFKHDRCKIVVAVGAVLAPTVVVPMLVPHGEELSGAVVGGVLGGEPGAAAGARAGASIDQAVHQGRLPSVPPSFFDDEDENDSNNN
jgi:ribulose 1,5-bisphosphate carboxylase large subunit-like protein